MHPYNSIDTTAAWKKLRFNLSDSSYFHMTDNLLIAIHAFASQLLIVIFGWWGCWICPRVSENHHFVWSKLATLVEGDSKAPFLIATTSKCRGGRYSIPRIAPLYL